MSPEARSGAAVQAGVHLVLATVALASVSRRDPSMIRGPRPLWMLVIPASVSRVRKDSAWVLPVGPLAYFLLGRRSS